MIDIKGARLEDPLNRILQNFELFNRLELDESDF